MSKIIKDDQFIHTLLPNEIGVYKRTVNGKLSDVRICKLYSYDSRSQEYVIQLDNDNSTEYKTFKGRGNYPIKETTIGSDMVMEFVTIFK